jgi:hypothetical protein
MTFLGLLKAETDAREWCWEARDLLGFIRDGMSERKAAERARVTQEQLRQWKRIPGFRNAIRRAKREGPVVHIWSMDDLTEDDLSEPSIAPAPGTSEREIERQGWRRA